MAEPADPVSVGSAVFARDLRSPGVEVLGNGGNILQRPSVGQVCLIDDNAVGGDDLLSGRPPR